MHFLQCSQFFMPMKSQRKYFIVYIYIFKMIVLKTSLDYWYYRSSGPSNKRTNENPKRGWLLTFTFSSIKSPKVDVNFVSFVTRNLSSNQTVPHIFHCWYEIIFQGNTSKAFLDERFLSEKLISLALGLL